MPIKQLLGFQLPVLAQLPPQQQQAQPQQQQAVVVGAAALAPQLSTESNTDYLEMCSPIAPENLLSFLGHSDTLLVDVRSEEAFLKAHLRGSLPLSLPTVLWRRFLKGRHTPGSLARHLLSEALSPLKNLSADAMVVLYDEETANPALLPEEAPLRVFAEYFARAKANVCFIEGGFRAAKGPLVSLVEASQFGLGLGTKVVLVRPGTAEASACAAEGRKRPAPSTELNWIHGFLAVGSEKHAHDVALLKSEGVTHILNLTNNPVLPEAKHQFHALQLEMRDSLSENLLSRLQSALEFIESARITNGRVLVHCFAGVSRSVSVSIAYLMWAFQLTLDNAMTLVKQHRECASPNLNFIGQLMMFEKTLGRTPPAGSPATPDTTQQPLTPPPSLHTACQNALDYLNDAVPAHA